MLCRARADGAVVRVLRVGLPARVADGGGEDALVLRGRVVLEEDVLCAPEAAGRERRDLGGAFACVRGREGDEQV